MYELGDTIAAVATPPGLGGIGILRVSGPKALTVAQCLFKTKRRIESKRQVLLGWFQDPHSHEILDEGLLLVMPKPHSYTAEDVVEFHVHGSPSLLQVLLNLLSQQGIRSAFPGEFTYRAFANGRLDLTQAEAVEAIVSSQGESARRQAVRQLTGGLATHLEPTEEILKSLYLKVEASLEFSEDGIESLDIQKYLTEVKNASGVLKKLIQSYEQGKVIRDGLVVALVGPPNTGKSSLLNAILGNQRAIVTAEPGTTRDVIEGDLLIKGVKVRLFDTAGLRESNQLIEVEGIRRSKVLLEEADLLFWLVDANDPLDSLQALQKINLKNDRTWILYNKIDLVPGFKKEIFSMDRYKQFEISCFNGTGLEGILNALETSLQSHTVGENVLVTHQRHFLELEKSEECLERLQSLIRSGVSHELWAEELREALLALGRIRGKNLSSAAFEEIFSKFCIGK